MKKLRVIKIVLGENVLKTIAVYAKNDSDVYNQAFKFADDTFGLNHDYELYVQDIPSHHRLFQNVSENNELFTQLI